jgi:hypothetical protein
MHTIIMVNNMTNELVHIVFNTKMLVTHLFMRMRIIRTLQCSQNNKSIRLYPLKAIIIAAIEY